MEAAKVRAGLKPGHPISKGMSIPWPCNRQKTPQRIAWLQARIANIRAMDAIDLLGSTSRSSWAAYFN